MKKILFVIVTLLCNTLNGMFVQTARLGARKTRAGTVIRRPIQPIMPTIQKRTLYRPELMKDLYSKLSETARPASPIFGAAKYESGALQKMYSVESDAPAIKLVQALFFQRDVRGAIKPTALKSNPAYSLTPSILGFVMGALEVNLLQDPTTREFIIEQWLAEQRNITGDKMTSPTKIQNFKTKIEDLLEIVEAEYAHDKNSARSILMGFLYAKANPDKNHDMLHYLTSLSQYITIFTSDENIETPTFTQKSSGGETFESIKTVFQNYTYTPSHYESARNALDKITTPAEQIHYATTEGFEEIVSLIFKNKQESALYPPTVIQSAYGFQGKKSRPNCVETAFQDLFNILLYDAKTQSFDLSLLPKSITPHKAFVQFYSLQSNVNNVNSPAVGQAFMNLVSDIPEALYSMDNYELQGGKTYHNFIVLMNHLLGINAILDEGDETVLGAALSDQRRTVTFTYNPEGSPKKISMTINDHQTGNQLHADFCFRQGHGFLEVPQRIGKAANRLLNPSELLQDLDRTRMNKAF